MTGRSVSRARTAITIQARPRMMAQTAQNVASATIRRRYAARIDGMVCRRFQGMSNTTAKRFLGGPRLVKPPAGSSAGWA
jgi:hypothetical protein